MQEQKTERIDIRTTPTAKAILQQAASSVHKSVSEFLLDIGLSTASETLADRKLFALSDKQWQQFQQALDQPSKERSKLKNLLTEPGVFD
jgi:uncharacterized protein (DUF1778 family)